MELTTALKSLIVQATGQHYRAQLALIVFQQKVYFNKTKIKPTSRRLLENDVVL
jgi:hypothetical protein